jgi:hypothetical protein
LSSCTIAGHLPSQATNYKGTATLLQWTELQKDVNGRWTNDAYVVNVATAWMNEGNQLILIGWNNQLPQNGDFAFEVPAGNANYRVIGITAWMAGSTTIYDYAVVSGTVTC